MPQNAEGPWLTHCLASTVSVTATNTVTVPTTVAVTDMSSLTITDTATQTVDVEVTVTTTTTTTITVNSVMKRGVDKRQATVMPSVIPSYAEGPCNSDAASYISACLCVSATASTTYAPTPITTVSVTTTVTLTPTVSQYTTETLTSTAWTTMTTSVTTGTTTITATATATVCGSSLPADFHLRVSAPGLSIDGTYASLGQSYHELGATEYVIDIGASLADADIFALDPSTGDLVLPFREGSAGNPMVLYAYDGLYGAYVGAVDPSQVAQIEASELSCQYAANTGEVTCSAYGQDYWQWDPSEGLTLYVGRDGADFALQVDCS